VKRLKLGMHCRLQHAGCSGHKGFPHLRDARADLNHVRQPNLRGVRRDLSARRSDWMSLRDRRRSHRAVPGCAPQDGVEIISRSEDGFEAIYQADKQGTRPRAVSLTIHFGWFLRWLPNGIAPEKMYCSCTADLRLCRFSPLLTKDQRHPQNPRQHWFPLSFREI
jgi:hypothetical protein